MAALTTAGRCLFTAAPRTPSAARICQSLPALASQALLNPSKCFGSMTPRPPIQQPAVKANSDSEPKRVRLEPWERSSLRGAAGLDTGPVDEEEWLDGEIARFVPMTPWPLNMQQVLDMLDPQRLAKYLAVEVPVRVAERIRWIEDIPDWDKIPLLAEVHGWHRNTFRNLRVTKRKKSLDPFTQVVQEAVTTSEDMPNKLAFAMHQLHVERGEEYGSSFADSWLDNFLLNCIGTNFIMAQYLAAASRSDEDEFAGIIDPHCNVPELCREVADEIVSICGEETKKRPVVKVEAYSTCGEDRGVPNFAFMPGYLRYVLMEVLKNSCHATADKAKNTQQLMKMPITIIVCADEHRVAIRINDRAGGIPFDVGERVWSYFYSTTKKQEGDEYGDAATELAGYGVGLPLSRLFAKYLGGSLRLNSLPGYGTSVDIDFHRVTADQVENVPDDDNDAGGDMWNTRSSMDHLKLGGH